MNIDEVAVRMFPSDEGKATKQAEKKRFPRKGSGERKLSYQLAYYYRNRDAILLKLKEKEKDPVWKARKKETNRAWKKRNRPLLNKWREKWLDANPLKRIEAREKRVAKYMEQRLARMKKRGDKYVYRRGNPNFPFYLKPTKYTRGGIEAQIQAEKEKQK